MRKTLGILIYLLILSSCSNKNYSVESICDCYSKSELTKFDKKLNNCLLGFNTDLNNNEKLNSKELYKAELSELTKKLISNCKEYQTDFNEVLLNKYSKWNPNKIKKNELQKKIDNNDNKALNQIKLSELEIAEGNFKRAENLINQSIKLNSNTEKAYLVRSYLNHKKNDFKQAILDFEIIRKITKSNDLKFMADLCILNLKKEMK